MIYFKSFQIKSSEIVIQVSVHADYPTFETICYDQMNEFVACPQARFICILVCLCPCLFVCARFFVP